MRERILFGVRVRLKSESKLIKFMNFFIKPFLYGFMDTYWTTIGTTTYAPTYFDGLFLEPEENLQDHKMVLEHELIHINDYKKYHIWFILTYLFPPFLFAYGRFRWESKAYLPELQSIIDSHQYSYFYTRLDEICNELDGPGYLWCWPKSWIKKWFLKKTEMVILQ